SVLQLRTKSATEVPSPAGLVRSEVMETRDQGVRLVLNIVPRTWDIARGRIHSYPEHVALRTNDVKEAARAAKQAGMQMLEVPGNYYEDLAARFDFEDSDLHELRELNLLFDRDDKGEFLHFYTAVLGELFFEIVERRGSYDGFGEPNAPVRFAAQQEINKRAHRG